LSTIATATPRTSTGLMRWAKLGGVAYVVLFAIGVILLFGNSPDSGTYHHQVFPGLIHSADDTSWLLHASGGVGLGAMIIAASLAGLRARAVPGWAGWLGVVAGIISLALIVFFPWFVAAIWILVVSIGLFVRGSREDAVVA
jgi:hypothetical protein